MGICVYVYICPHAHTHTHTRATLNRNPRTVCGGNSIQNLLVFDVFLSKDRSPLTLSAISTYSKPRCTLV